MRYVGGYAQCRELCASYLVEPVLTTVADVHHLDDLRSQTRIEHVGLAELGLEVGTTREDKTSHINLVLGDVVLHGEFGDLTDVVVALFVTETGETERGLTTTAVLLWEVDSELVNDFTGVASYSAEKGAVTVHDDEAELGVRLKQLLKGLGVELVVAKVQGAIKSLNGRRSERSTMYVRVDRLVGLEVE